VHQPQSQQRRSQLRQKPRLPFFVSELLFDSY
jgi:hypothetical protein